MRQLEHRVSGYPDDTEMHIADLRDMGLEPSVGLSIDTDNFVYASVSVTLPDGRKLVSQSGGYGLEHRAIQLAAVAVYDNARFALGHCTRSER